MIGPIAFTLVALGVTSFFWGMVLSVLSYANRVPAMQKFSIRISRKSNIDYGLSASLIALGFLMMMTSFIP